MRITDLRGVPIDEVELPRAKQALSDARSAAETIVVAVRRDGETALREQAERFDGVTGHAIRVPAEHRTEALAALDPAVRAALEEAIRRVREASTAQVPEPRTTTFARGAVVEQRWQPVAAAGVYIPGGKAVYPSSVIMNVVPAQVAGVGRIALASPPQRDHGGRIHPTILAAAALLGIDEVYAIGGAGAIAALAYGVPEVGLAPVDTVTGPGNNFVAAAKRIVAGDVGTDSEAGATEILIVADDAANPSFLAADLISQAEHDEQAAAVLVTDSLDLAERVSAAVANRVAGTANAARARLALDGEQSAIVVVDDLAQAIAISNAYGPEHLELQFTGADPADFTNAGAIFDGPYSPVSLGDYLAGSNHVLPTDGNSRFSAGLGASTFLRPQQVIRYDRAALAEVAEKIVSLAEAEALPAHGEAVTVRFEEE